MSEPIENRDSELFGGGEVVKAPKPPSLAEQFVGVFTEPVALFQKLHDAPSWGWALGAIMSSALLLTVVWGLKVDADAMLRPAMEQNPKLTAAQIDQAIEISSKFMLPMGIAGALIMAPVATAFMSLLYWLIGMGTAEAGKPSYLQAISATTVAGLVGVPYMLLITLMCFLRTVGGLSPEKLSPTSLGFYLQPENPKLYALFCQLDLFLIAGYVMVYLAARHTLRLKTGGAAACTAIAVIFGMAFKILFAK